MRFEGVELCHCGWSDAVEGGEVIKSVASWKDVMDREHEHSPSELALCNTHHR